MPNPPYIFNFETINKRQDITVDGVTMLDLTQPMVEYKRQLLILRPPVYVTRELRGRPDLISKAVYKSEDYTDLLLFFNELSNPLMVDEGMLLIVPELDSMLANLATPKVNVQNETQKRFVAKLPTIDKNRIKQLIANATNQKVSDASIRTPNMLPEGAKKVTPIDGRVVLGTSMSGVSSPGTSLADSARSATRIKLTGS